jgi:hypothetical protein
MRKLGFILMVYFSIAGIGCYYDNEVVLYGVEECSADPATFSGTIAPIIARNCLTCHSQSVASGGVMMETFAQVSLLAESGKLVGVVTHASGFSPMPKNAAQLSDCNIIKIREWVDAGALDN